MHRAQEMISTHRKGWSLTDDHSRVDDLARAMYGAIVPSVRRNFPSEWIPQGLSAPYSALLGVGLVLPT